MICIIDNNACTLTLDLWMYMYLLAVKCNSVNCLLFSFRLAHHFITHRCLVIINVMWISRKHLLSFSHIIPTFYINLYTLQPLSMPVLYLSLIRKLAHWKHRCQLINFYHIIPGELAHFHYVLRKQVLYTVNLSRNNAHWQIMIWILTRPKAKRWSHLIIRVK